MKNAILMTLALSAGLLAARAPAQTAVNAEAVALLKELADLQFAALNSAEGEARLEARRQADRAFRDAATQVRMTLPLPVIARSLWSVIARSPWSVIASSKGSVIARSEATKQSRKCPRKTPSPPDVRVLHPAPAAGRPLWIAASRLRRSSR